VKHQDYLVRKLFYKNIFDLEKSIRDRSCIACYTHLKLSQLKEMNVYANSQDLGPTSIQRRLLSSMFTPRFQGVHVTYLPLPLLWQMNSKRGRNTKLVKQIIDVKRESIMRFSSSFLCNFRIR
jgi:hypothetical protein